VLRSDELFEGVDVQNELNKAYYTIDLTPVLTTDNPNKEVYVKFTDGSTGDGWGPGIFWMAVYSGPITLLSDQRVFDGLKAMNAEPQAFGLNLLHRRYTLDSAKTLEQIILPARSGLEANTTYLLAATLNPAAAEVALTFSLAATNTLRLSWPASATGYHLESSATLTGAWSEVTETPALENNQFVVEIPIANGQRFLRLRQ